MRVRKISVNGPTRCSAGLGVGMVYKLRREMAASTFPTPYS